MGNISVNKQDLRRLNAKLRHIKLGTQKDVLDSLKVFVLNSVADIKKDSPVDTGNLRKSVNGNMINKNSAIVESIALSEDNFDYAPVQEFGSVYRKGKPYFYPNIMRNFKRALVLLRAKNKRTVRK